MQQYKNLIQDILDNGVETEDRTGVGTLSVFGRQVRYDLTKGFPLVTTKRTFWKGVVIELLWILRGDTRVDWLNKHGVTIWDEWVSENDRSLGPVYGFQYRKWGGETYNLYGKQYPLIDQLKNLIEGIKTNPTSRRHIVNLWNVGDIDEMALPPCHMMHQFYVRDNKLSCMLYQRSGDIFLGIPFNIASYALLTHLIANECGLEVGEFVHTIGDAHIYKNHIDQCKELLTREPLPLPTIEIKIPQGELLNFIDGENLKNNMTFKDISKLIVLKDYKSHSTIKAEVAV